MPIHNNIKSIAAIKRVLANSLALGSFVGLVVATTLSQNSITSVDVMASGNPFGTSIRFYGTGKNYEDRVEIPVQGNKLNIGATDFTIEFWMKVPTGVTNTPVGGGNGWIWGNIILDRDIYGNHANDFGLSLFNGNLRFGTGPDVNAKTIQTSGVNVADGQWHHVAVVRTLGGEARIYVDGIQRASGSVQGGDISYSGSHSGYINPPKCTENKDPYLVLGAEKHDYFWCSENDATKARNNAYNGLLDDLRISNIARYNANFTRPILPHPIDSHTIALYRFDFDNQNAIDSTNNPVNGVIKPGVTLDNGVDDPCTRFNDVSTSYDFYPYICYLRAAGVVSGYPGNLYKPQNLVNRGEMAKFIFIGAGLNEATTCDNFPDVPNNAPFHREITSLKCAGIVSGYPQSSGPNVYKSNNNVTRGEMAKFIKNAFNIPTDTTCDNFPDVPNNAPFYQEITSLKCAGIVSGYPQSDGSNIYKPNNNVTRGEVAKFVTLAMWFNM